MLCRITAGIKEFIRLESAGGIVLMGALVLGMLFENSPLTRIYDAFLDTPVEVRIGGLGVAKPALLWINDGLMAIFFFLVGLELKREFLEGELSSVGQVMLPAVAALGGMVVPAGIYVMSTWHDPVALRGWAIPAATDIAFALGILSLLGERVPLALRVFLASLALFDDIGAIVIIALFYSGSISYGALAASGIIVTVLFALNRAGVASKTPYVLFGMALWVAVLKSGIHATLAGVILALFVPLSVKEGGGRCPLREFEHDLHPTVAFLIMPLFAFANAGVSLAGVGWSSFTAPIPLGVAAGLLIGKQLGVFLFSWAAVRLGLAEVPEGTNWTALYGVSLLCGIGFTMSLFIRSLAFAPGTIEESMDGRLGILAGSLLSGLFGYLVLRRALKKGLAD